MAVDRRSASERVRDRLKALAAEKPHGFKKLVAEELGVANATVTPWFDGSREPSLDQLERICQMTEMRLAELVSADGSSLYELNAEEAVIIRALRGWPATVRRALLAFLLFFVNEDAVAGQSRRMQELWRHLDARARQAVYGFAVQKSEGMIPPEIEARLFAELSDEAKAAVGKRTTKRRRNDDA